MIDWALAFIGGLLMGGAGRGFVDGWIAKRTARCSWCSRKLPGGGVCGECLRSVDNQEGGRAAPEDWPAA